jgi:hypothetical protein
LREDDTIVQRTREPTPKSAPRELGVDAQAVFELGGWRYSDDDVAVAFVPDTGGG